MEFSADLEPKAKLANTHLIRVKVAERQPDFPLENLAVERDCLRDCSECACTYLKG
jgi:hypothetical protein